jgi:hypothetical protein
VFPARYWNPRYWAARYWPKNTGPISEGPCTYTPGPRNRYGVKRKYGTCKKYGDGFSDEWLYAGNDPVADPFYAREIPDDVLSRHDTTALNVDSNDELSVNFDATAADETFYLRSPNGTVYHIVIHGDTGHIDIESGDESIEFGSGPNFQIALLNFCLPWQPSLPIT